MNTKHNALELYEIHVRESLSLFVCLVFFCFRFLFVLFFILSLFYFFKNNKEEDHYIATRGES